MPKNHRVVFTATDTAAVAQLQTLPAAGSLILNGSSKDTLVEWAGTVRFNHFNRKVTITSTGNLTGVNFTITGTDTDYNTLTETIAGPNNATVTSTNAYNRVSSITTSGAVATAVQVGDDSVGTSAWIPMDVRVAKFQISVNAQITGTINYTVNHTFDNVLDPNFSANPQVIACPTAALVAAVTSQYTFAYTSPVAAVQFVVNSSSGGTLTGIIIEEGIAA